MTDIKGGDFIKVPKGTTVYETTYHTSTTVTKRESTVEVSKVATISVDVLSAFLSKNQADDLQREINKRTQELLKKPEYAPVVRINRADRKLFSDDPKAWEAMWEDYRKVSDQYHNDCRVIDQTVRQEFADRAQADLGADVRLVYWSNNGKFAFSNAVTKTEPPVRATKAKVPTKREQMVPKSRWKFSADTEVKAWFENPDYQKELKAFYAARPARGPYVPFKTDTPEFVEKVMFTAKADQVFTVTGKSSQSWNCSQNGLLIPIKGEESGKERYVPYKSLEPYVELVDMPELHYFVIRDTETGQFYKGYDWRTRSPEMVAKAHQGKKFDNTGRVKTSLLDLCGYFEGMNDGNRPEWMGDGGKAFDIPKTWEIVKVHKFTKTEVEVIDIQNWLDRTWSLRPLTLKFGSAVRSIYNELDKDGKVDEFTGMLVFSRTDIDEDDYASDWDWPKEEIKLVDEAVKAGGFARGTFKKAKDSRGIAVGFKSVDDAMMVKLYYTGSLRMSVLDLKDMKEVVS